MGSRSVTPAGRRIYCRLQASGLELESTSRQVGFWIEGLLQQLGQEGVDRLMNLLVRMARNASNPSAWFNWATTKPWTALVPDEQIRFVFNGPPEPPRREQDCGLVSVGSVAALAVG